MAKKLAVVIAGLCFLGTPLFAQDAPSLADAARKARAEKNGTPSVSSQPSPAVDDATASPSSDRPSAVAARTGVKPDLNPRRDTDPDAAKKYDAAIRELFDREDFDAIDRLADEYRASKARFAGGFWKLHLMQSALDRPAAGLLTGASDSEWQKHLRRVTKWVEQKPNSISARTALAGSYLHYGWEARGGGYADTVSDEGWRLFGERAAKARNVLEDALGHNLKDPELLLTLMLTARAEQWEPDQQMALFERAVAFEPDYYYYYRLEAENLLPKWEGEPGEMARWADAQANRIGGKKGDSIYYEIATYLNCACDSDRNLNGMSWDRIKRGYAAVEQQYGPALDALNQLAYMAVMVNDSASARIIFQRIGDNWSKETWHNKKYFDDCRAWAKNADASITAASTTATTTTGIDVAGAFNAINENMLTPEGQQYDAKLSEALNQTYGPQIVSCLAKAADDGIPEIDLIMLLAKNGVVKQLLIFPPNGPTACLRGKLGAAVFPLPSKDNYWVKTIIHLK